MSKAGNSSTSVVTKALARLRRPCLSLSAATLASRALRQFNSAAVAAQNARRAHINVRTVVGSGPLIENARLDVFRVMPAHAPHDQGFPAASASRRSVRLLRFDMIQFCSRSISRNG